MVYKLPIYNFIFCYSSPNGVRHVPNLPFSSLHSDLESQTSTYISALPDGSMLDFINRRYWRKLRAWKREDGLAPSYLFPVVFLTSLLLSPYQYIFFFFSPKQGQFLLIENTKSWFQFFQNLQNQLHHALLFGCTSFSWLMLLFSKFGSQALGALI